MFGNAVNKLRGHPRSAVARQSKTDTDMVVAVTEKRWAARAI
jgi:hypothetical protein